MSTSETKPVVKAQIKLKGAMRECIVRNESTCNKCGAPIVWVALDLDGEKKYFSCDPGATNGVMKLHIKNCPEADSPAPKSTSSANSTSTGREAIDAEHRELQQLCQRLRNWLERHEPRLAATGVPTAAIAAGTDTADSKEITDADIPF
jgi:hypothetical protein